MMTPIDAVEQARRNAAVARAKTIVEEIRANAAMAERRRSGRQVEDHAPRKSPEQELDDLAEASRNLPPVKLSAGARRAIGIPDPHPSQSREEGR